MNLQGYDSDASVSSDNDASVFETVRNEGRSNKGSVQKSLPDSEFGSASADYKRTRHRSSRADKKKKKAQKLDPESIEFSGPWADSSSEQSYCEEPESSSDSESEHPLSNVHTTTELYRQVNFMKPRSEYLKKDGDSQVASEIKKVLKGHSGGVTQLRFFPNSGHLLLSCGNDGRILLWDLHSSAEVRGYFGHTEAVKDIVFDSTGKRFLSCSYDRKVLLWDTETGQSLRTFQFSATPNCLSFNSNNNQEFLVGLANHKIEHYSLDEPSPLVQVYDHHLGAINSLTMVSDKVFMSTSDDRSIRFWKWHVNIPSKIIADPSQHSMPRACKHPKESFIALQSMENKIHIIQNNRNFRSIKTKLFEGHRVIGYGVSICFSNDGEYIMSGDLGGNVFIWSWKSTRLLKKLKAQDKVISCLAAHPLWPNVIAAAGKSGQIVYYE